MARAEGAARDILERARAEAQRQAANVIEAARTQAMYEAQQIRQEGERDASRLREEAAAATGRLPDGTGFTPIHSVEIGSHDFPIALRGYDRAAVRTWLTTVELAHAVLEHELERARVEWARAVSALEAVVREPRANANGAHADVRKAIADFDQAAGAVPGVHATAPVFEALAVRAQLLETALSRRLLGYDRADVHRLLQSAAAHVARLEAQADLLRAENARLRAEVLTRAATLAKNPV